jgi:hypothetical protein
MNSPIVISVVRDYAMYDKCIAKNQFVFNCQLEPIDNREHNEYISVCYNRKIEKFADANSWLIFCHEDFQFLEDPVMLLENADKNSIYGPIGGVLKKRFHPLFLEIWEGVFYGQILESEKDGSGVRELGASVNGGMQVETLDCQCVIVHSSLFAKHRLRFDEKLSFDLYVEDFCVSARLEYAVSTRILPMRCQHYSRGCIALRFFEQLKYLREKYPKYEAFGVTGYYIGAGRTSLRRFQKKVRGFLDRYCGSLVKWLLKAI